MFWGPEDPGGPPKRGLFGPLFGPESLLTLDQRSKKEGQKEGVLGGPGVDPGTPDRLEGPQKGVFLDLFLDRYFSKQ